MLRYLIFLPDYSEIKTRDCSSCPRHRRQTFTTDSKWNAKDRSLLRNLQDYNQNFKNEADNMRMGKRDL